MIQKLSTWQPRIESRSYRPGSHSRAVFNSSFNYVLDPQHSQSHTVPVSVIQHLFIFGSRGLGDGCIRIICFLHTTTRRNLSRLALGQKKLKQTDFGLAREETVTKMMTAETGTYRWMALEIALLSCLFLLS
eukprot:TRINITY_DN8578_c0_g1_i4.p1 TRINITY_DN8578_c0_g1~~TRINITY_DN8578_c0_g1_i4.p1  ORF type:complete len:132 (-),score=8.17 TRINITY_DN8578_c0_g1_i4:97-492(-)